MRKTRDYDAELESLDQKTKALKQRKISKLGRSGDRVLGRYAVDRCSDGCIALGRKQWRTITGGVAKSLSGDVSAQNQAH